MHVGTADMTSRYRKNAKMQFLSIEKNEQVTVVRFPDLGQQFIFSPVVEKTWMFFAVQVDASCRLERHC